jgi:dynein light chain roadblock-type
VQLIKRLNDRAISVIRDLDPNDQLRFLRLKSQKHEIIVAPEKEYILVTIQDPQ